MSATAKTAGDESFPVASLLLDGGTRRAVMAFYAFARTADDIADSPRLSVQDKLDRLDALEAGLCAAGSGPAARLGRELALHGLDDAPARRLLSAFRADARGIHMADWDQVMDYCRHSAMPVGRFLLALHGEDDPRAAGASDSLCAALQIENHLQDLRGDYCGLGRVYLPQSWLDEARIAPEHLGGQRAGATLRTLIDRALDRVDTLLGEAAALPGCLTNRRLRGQAAATLSCATRLARRLRREDPLAVRVGLGLWDRLGAGATGLAGAVFAPPASGRRAT